MTDNHLTNPQFSANGESESVKVSVIIVNYNVRDLLRQALRSIERSLGNISSEVIVVDNDSVDGSVNMLIEEFPQITLIANQSNTGFSAANNQGIRIAKGEFLFILNPDTIIEEDTIKVLIDFMESHHDAGAVGCRILNPDGTFALESRRSFPTPAIAFYRTTGLSRIFPRSKAFGRYNLTFLPEDQITTVDALSGSCMFLRSSALINSVGNSTGRREAGLFDEDFFMYGEDLDLCYRIQNAGWAIYYTPETQIIHYKGESTKKGDLRYVRLFYGAMTHFAQKHLREDYPKIFLWVLHLAVIVRGSLTVLGNMLRHAAARDLALCFGVITVLGLLRSFQSGFQFPPVFYWGISPLFAFIVTGVIAAWGGYRGRGPRLGLVLLGSLVAVIALAALSFFVKQVAFSRMVVLACLPACLLLLSAVRLIPKTRKRMGRRTIVVGNLLDANILASQQLSQFVLTGIVTQDRKNDSRSTLTRLGHYDQLRDIVRIHSIETVIFASASLTNKEIFALMQKLLGIPIHTYILAEHENHLIGKSVIKNLGDRALLDAEEVIGSLRSSTARRVSDIIAGLMGAVIHPVILLISKLTGPNSRWAHRCERTRQWRTVLLGKRSLIGFDEKGEFIPNPEWQLQPGVFAVSEMLGPRLKRPPEEIEHAYWYYVRNQSTAMDWMIAARALRGSA